MDPLVTVYARTPVRAAATTAVTSNVSTTPVSRFSGDGLPSSAIGCGVGPGSLIPLTP